MSITEVCIQKPVFAWMLMAATVVFGLVAAHAHRHQPVPRRRLPDHQRLRHLGGRRARGRRERRRRADRGGRRAGRGRPVHHLVGAPGQRPRSPSSWTSRATWTSRCRTCRRRSRRRSGALPRDVDPPVVSKTNPEDQPIMWIGLSGPYSPQMLADYARYRVKEKLQTVAGRRRDHAGRLPRAQRAHLGRRADSSTRAGSPSTDVIARAAAASTSSCPRAASRPRAARSTCASSARRSTSTTLRDIVVREHGGAPSTCEDVALVEDGFEDVRRLSRVDGEPAQGMGIRKQRGANAVAVAAKGVTPTLDEMRKTLPEGMELGHQLRLDPLHRGVGPRDRVRADPGGRAHGAGVLDVPGLAVEHAQRGAGHPHVAARARWPSIYFLGFTLNTFTLLGLALAVGIVVDDAIMVLENIFRHAEMGKDRVRAAREGTARDHLRGAGRHARRRGHLHPRHLHEGDRRQASSSSSA